MDIGTSVAGDAITKIFVDPVIQLVKDVIHKNENRQILQNDLGRMEKLLLDIDTLFQHQHKELPESVKNWLEMVRKSLVDAKSLLHRSDPRQRCLQCLTCNPVRLSKQIRGWNESFGKLYQDFHNDFSLLATAGQIASSAPQHSKVTLLQNIAASGFVGSGNETAQRQVEMWLSEGDQVRLIGAYGMAGVGKTTLQKMVYNKFKVSGDFDNVIWVTVSQNFEILKLQGDIAREVNLSLPSNSSVDMQKRMLSDYMMGKKFLLVLDDLWSRLDLQELGVAFGLGKDSKVLFSTRRKDLIQEMEAEKSIEIQPLSREEARMLFQKIAFKDGHVPTEKEECARNVADECKGLPLALTVVAATMKAKSSVAEWEDSLSLMKSSDPSFPLTHPSVDREVYQRIRLSYDALQDSALKNCFLYCAMFPEDEVIEVDELVRRWISEGLVRSEQGKHLMDMAIGRIYAKFLVDRCLFQNVQNEEIENVWESYRIKVHDVIRDVAIYIGQKEENCYFMARQDLGNFQEIPDGYRKKRISLVYNGIGNLPTEFTCPRLVSLTLARNPIAKIPGGFLNTLTSLKVLDLSGTRILSIPPCVRELRQLEFLALCGLRIKDLPEEICQLSRLQFLSLEYCVSLDSLPSKIGDLKHLKYLNLTRCDQLRIIPNGISELTSLSTLDLKGTLGLRVEAEAADMSIWGLKDLKNLTQLAVKVRLERGIKSGIEVGIMGTWSEMRHLWLSYEYSYQNYRGLMEYLPDVVMEDLPEDMQDMKKLQSFILENYTGLSLPVSTSKLQHLENVKLQRCAHLTVLSPLEGLPNLKFLHVETLVKLRWLGIGSSRRPNGGFQMLEKLHLRLLLRLEGMAGPTGDEEWDEQTLPRLRVLKIWNCRSLKTFPRGMEKLSNLTTIFAEKDWWEAISWEDENMKPSLEKLYRSWAPKRLLYRAPKRAVLECQIMGYYPRWMPSTLASTH